jgi:hypothetical protein
VGGAIDEVEQRLGIGPDRHVDEKQRIGGRSQVGRVVAVPLQAPDKAGSGIGQGVDGIEFSVKARHLRVAALAEHPPDVDLCQVPIRHRRYFRAFATTLSGNSSPNTRW